MFRLSWGDVWRGLVVATLAPAFLAILAVLGAVILAPGFDVFTIEWVALFKGLTNALIVSAYGGFSGYILKNLLTDNSQNFLGIETKS